MSSGTLTKARYGPYPWSFAGNDEVPIVGGRPCVVVPDDVEEICVDVCEAALPPVGQWSNGKGEGWRKFELPASRTDAVGDLSAEEMHLTMLAVRSNSWGETISVPGGLLPIHVLQEDEESDTPANDNGRSLGGAAVTERGDALRDGSHGAQLLIDNYLDFINGMYEHTRSHSLFWEGNVRGFAVRSVARALARWRKISSKSEPRMALIVKLARELPDVLADVCRRPRQVLRRVRQRQDVGRIQELDAACLRWLARQPGKTIIEKAGPKQQLLGVMRVEDTDTPENRMVKDLLRRAHRECRRYLMEHRSFGEHTRVRDVRRFDQLVVSLRRTSAFASVRPLAGVARPNYVLQHDPRYRRLWDAYILLVHQEKQQDSVWRWRQRTWAEQCGLSMLSSIQSLPATGPAMRSDMLFQYEHATGAFLGPATQIGHWTCGDPRNAFRIDFLLGSQMADYPGISNNLRMLSPDYVLVFSTDRNGRHGARMLGVWTIFDFGRSHNDLSRHAESLNSAVEQYLGNGAFRALLIEPCLDGSNDSSDISVRCSSTEALRLSVQPKRQEESLRSAIQRGLGIV